jgi:hypothetical protein
MFNSILSILYRDKVSNVKNEISKMSKIIAVGLYHGGAVGLLVAKTCALVGTSQITDLDGSDQNVCRE